MKFFDVRDAIVPSNAYNIDRRLQLTSKTTFISHDSLLTGVIDEVHELRFIIVISRSDSGEENINIFSHLKCKISVHDNSNDCYHYVIIGVEKTVT